MTVFQKQINMGRPRKDQTTSMHTSTKSAKIALKPLMGYVLVEPSTADIQTASGIYLPETAQEKPAQGTVISIGEDLVLENGKVMHSPVKVGDKVVYKKWGGDEIKVSGVEYKLVKFDDLMAILD
jgi:chaperonin GroES